MDTWLGQCCIYVSDLERAVASYEGLGLTCTSRTDIDEAKEAVVEHPGKGGKLQLAQHLGRTGPIDMGNAFWKLYVATNDMERLFNDAASAGYEPGSAPARTGRWPLTVAF